MPRWETYEWSNDDSGDQSNDVSPDRHSDVLFDHDDQAENEAEDKHGHIPPPRDFLVVLCHVLVVTVVVSPFSGALVCFLDVAAPEQDGMGNESTDLT